MESFESSRYERWLLEATSIHWTWNRPECQLVPLSNTLHEHNREAMTPSAESLIRNFMSALSLELNGAPAGQDEPPSPAASLKDIRSNAGLDKGLIGETPALA